MPKTSGLCGEVHNVPCHIDLRGVTHEGTKRSQGTQLEVVISLQPRGNPGQKRELWRIEGQWHKSEQATHH